MVVKYFHSVPSSWDVLDVDAFRSVTRARRRGLLKISTDSLGVLLRMYSQVRTNEASPKPSPIGPSLIREYLETKATPTHTIIALHTPNLRLKRNCRRVTPMYRSHMGRSGTRNLKSLSEVHSRIKRA